MHDIKKIVRQLHPLERKILPFLKSYNTLIQITKNSGMQEIEAIRALQWLEAKGIVKTEQIAVNVARPTSTGISYIEQGLPEKRFIQTIKTNVMNLEEIKKKAALNNEEVNVCIGMLRRQEFIETIKDKEVKIKITNKGQEILEKGLAEEDLLYKIKEGAKLGIFNEKEKRILEELRKRNIIKIEEEKDKKIQLTNLGKELVKEEIYLELIEGLTPELLKSKQWKGKEFREYNIKAAVSRINGGRQHPLQETMNQIRRIFMNMGFKEMEGPLVETTFWCMDSMWIPQDHPAREMQDTFYLPYEGKLPENLKKKVATVHETGGNSGSKGYGYKWDENIAKQLLLRTHTTATTFRYFGEKGLKQPAKYFYIGRIFRNEAIDSTHLPEFHHSEGFVMDEGLTLRDLMGYIKEFYSQMGIHKIKFRPTYNPYTEPSMEAIGFNEQLGKWVELINSGIFRPESLEPYGIKVPVIAWGLGVERLAMMLHQQKSIREMLGATGDFNWLRNHKVVKKW
ncbi:MAG TPA: phenylalanine--tRNA ligase subunit alpha [Candidatus Nanoarchaeia archaeon]|nr:phenylalanine--tRNA ligase subunit alpha [Candidatus Nanoarchaeia archaeon]